MKEQLSETDVIEEKDNRYVTGKEIFSTLLPTDLNLEFKAKTCLNCEVCTAPKCPNDAYVIVKNGVLKQGTVDENSIGAFKGKILLK
jgi:DNA-directed RNA polymerase subunit A'